MKVLSFNQKEREAIINILLLAMYSDNLLSLREDDKFTQILARLGWKSGIARGNFVHSAITRPRVANTQPEHREEYLKSCIDEFKSDRTIQEVLKLLQEFLDADGRSIEEQSFYQEIQKLLARKR